MCEILKGTIQSRVQEAVPMSTLHRRWLLRPGLERAQDDLDLQQRQPEE